MALLVIVRHGQSAWNLENRFTGDVDVDLTQQGEKEATDAGKLLRAYRFDKAYTSVLKRAIRTLEIILNENDHKKIGVIQDAALNERRYGDLQGLNKEETAKKFGNEQVMLWRRSYDIRPPNGESLKDTYDRVMPYYHKELEPQLRNGKNILIVAHGNSLRALMMYLEDISVADITGLNLATGVPRSYEFDRDMRIVNCAYVQ